MRRILMDMRWEGTGGIGTFAKEINRINRYETPGFSGKPYSPFDPIKTALRLIKKKTVLFSSWIFTTSFFIRTIRIYYT